MVERHMTVEIELQLDLLLGSDEVAEVGGAGRHDYLVKAVRLRNPTGVGYVEVDVGIGALKVEKDVLN